VRACDAATFVTSELRRPLAQLRTDTASGLLWSSYLQLYFTSTSTIFQAIVTVCIAIRVLHGALSPGEFVSLTGLFGNCITPLQTVSSLQRMAIMNAGSLKAIDEVLSATLLDEGAGDDQAEPLNPHVSRIELAAVAFRYAADAPLALHATSLTFQVPSYNVLCGGSGSGKSTLLSLLMRFRPPSSGAVLFDGIDVRTRSLRSFRKLTGVVFQECLIFNGTVRSNIAFGHAEGDAGSVEQAARRAEIHDFILETLPGGTTPRSAQRVSGGSRAGSCSESAWHEPWRVVRGSCCLMRRRVRSILPLRRASSRRSWRCGQRVSPSSRSRTGRAPPCKRTQSSCFAKGASRSKGLIKSSLRGMASLGRWCRSGMLDVVNDSGNTGHRVINPVPSVARVM